MSTRVQKNPGFLKTQPSGFFVFYWVFGGFIWFFGQAGKIGKIIQKLYCFKAFTALSY